jgi:hypothetical protein
LGVYGDGTPQHRSIGGAQMAKKKKDKKKKKKK